MYLLLTLPLVEMIPVLQTAIGPMILISGVGMLLLNMTNRLGRTIDRSRQLLAKLKESDEEDRRRNKLQLDILWRRAHLLQTAIALIATSALLAALLVIVLFISALLKVESAVLLSALFMLCLGALIVALVYFLRDINLTLHALALELGREDQPRVPLTLAPTGRATRGNDSSTTE
jgi:Cu/Ag efflux pump CusA